MSGGILWETGIDLKALARVLLKLCSERDFGAKVSLQSQVNSSLSSGQDPFILFQAIYLMIHFEEKWHILNYSTWI